MFRESLQVCGLVQAKKNIERLREYQKHVPLNENLSKFSLKNTSASCLWIEFVISETLTGTREPLLMYLYYIVDPYSETLTCT